LASGARPKLRAQGSTRKKVIYLYEEFFRSFNNTWSLLKVGAAACRGLVLEGDILPTLLVVGIQKIILCYPIIHFSPKRNGSATTFVRMVFTGADTQKPTPLDQA